MIAAEAEQYRKDQAHVSKLVNSTWDQAILERNQKNNQNLGRWL